MTKLDEKRIAKELLKLKKELQSGKNKVRIPWYLVPQDILNDIVEATGGLVNPTKAKWIVEIKEGKRHYGVAG